MSTKLAVEKLTPIQVEVLESIARDPLAGGPHTGPHIRSFRSLEERGLAKHVFGGTKTMRVGSMSGNSWYEITPEGKKALCHARILMGKERATTLDGADLNTIAAALQFYVDAGQGDPDQRKDKIHRMACGEDIGAEDISQDKFGVTDLLGRVNNVRVMRKKAAGEFVRMHFTEHDQRPAAEPAKAAKKSVKP